MREITRARALLEARALEQADHRQREPDDGDVAAVDERLAERGDDVDEAEWRREPRRDRRDGDDEQRVQPEREADDDDEDADQREHVSG